MDLRFRPRSDKEKDFRFVPRERGSQKAWAGTVNANGDSFALDFENSWESTQGLLFHDEIHIKLNEEDDRFQKTLEWTKEKFREVIDQLQAQSWSIPPIPPLPPLSSLFPSPSKPMTLDTLTTRGLPPGQVAMLYGASIRPTRGSLLTFGMVCQDDIETEAETAREPDADWSHLDEEPSIFD